MSLLLNLAICSGSHGNRVLSLLCRVRLQHSQEVNEMEEILQKEISEVRENQLAKVRGPAQLGMLEAGTRTRNYTCSGYLSHN